MIDTIDGLIIIAPSQIDEQFFHRVLTISQQLVPQQLSRTGFYITISRMDGQFALGQQNISPVAGGLTAFAKTVAREFPDIFCRCLDIAADCHDYRNLSSELLFASHQEIGHDGTTNGYLETTSLDYPIIDKFPSNQLFLFSGGGRGITYQLAKKFLAQTDNRALLIGSSPVPEQRPLPELVDETTIKRQLMINHPRLTPRNIETKYRTLLKNRQLQTNLNELSSRYGQRLSYQQIDVRDPQAVAKLATEPITGLVHGAGILHDRLLSKLTNEDFQRVYETKVHGLQNLLEHIDPSRLQYLVLFSSLTARYGRKGQLAYAVANDIINKQAQQLNNRYPDLKVVAFNFGPWQGGGMVNSQLEKLFADEGLGLIPQDSGTNLCLKEIFATDKRAVERVMVVETPRTTKVFNYNLNEQPFLNSHRINNKIVLPLALIIDQLSNCQQTTTLKQIKVLNAVSFTSSYQLYRRQTATEIVLLDSQDRPRYQAKLTDNQPFGRQRGKLRVDNDKFIDSNLYGSGGLLFHGPHFHLLTYRIYTDYHATGLQTTVDIPSDKPIDIYAIDVLLQLAIVYSAYRQQSSLPMAIGCYRRYQQLQRPASYTATLIGREQQENRLICDAELSYHRDELYLRLQGIEMISLANR